MVCYLLIFAGKPDKDKLCHNDDGHEQQRGQADGGEPRPGHERPHARLRRCLKDQLDGEHPSIHPSKHSSTHPSIQVGSLRCTYPGLTSDCMASIMDQIQRSIRQKDDEMSWLDKSCLQLAVRRKDKTETLTFQVGASLVRRALTLMLQMRSPAVKQDWVVELRLARLALDPNNSPGWDILEQAKLCILGARCIDIFCWIF